MLCVLLFLPLPALIIVLLDGCSLRQVRQGWAHWAGIFGLQLSKPIIFWLHFILEEIWSQHSETLRQECVFEPMVGNFVRPWSQN